MPGQRYGDLLAWTLHETPVVRFLERSFPVFAERDEHHDPIAWEPSISCPSAVTASRKTNVGATSTALSIIHADRAGKGDTRGSGHAT